MRPVAALSCLALALSAPACSSSPAADGPVPDTDASADVPSGATGPEDAVGPDVSSPQDASSEPADAAAADGEASAADVSSEAAGDAPSDGNVAQDAASTWPDAHCLEVVSGHNVDDPSRVNVVFLYAGFDSPSTPLDVPHLIHGLVAGSPDNDYAFDPQLAPLYAVEGLAGIQPFASNLDRFNFWYVDLPLYGSGDLCSWLELPSDASCAGNVVTTLDKDGNPVDAVLSPQDVLPFSEAGKACELPNRYTHLVYAPTAVMDEPYFPKPGNYAVFGSYSQEILMFGASTSISTVFQNFVHEFVHAFGQVWDEKGDHLSPADYPAPVGGPNCFSLGPTEPLTAAACAANPALPWHDLIGNGCGLDGVVDCPVTRSYHDPNTNQDLVDRFDEWLYEVRDDVDGCGQGCLYTQGNVFRPFQGCNVMSSCDLTSEIRTGMFTRLGPVNEREVCRRIQAITGAVSPWCEALCPAGCPFGQRCVQGTCTDKADIP